MTTPILVPQLGNEITEAEVTEWVASEGDTLKSGDLIVVITTTKMAIEIEAPADGKLSTIAMPEGEIVEVGVTLGEIT
ncbi:MAG: lipoyl domain-containing protein [Rhizobiales bacterium]|nr:lipoyl domain-containing protein [Hyphomicrobiales bacterium]MBO6699964.1 lipoyl domain-containing protein [Hyphomicrobiales bacterium]MBO6737871.1 lipoyl domain-containing protein [Hyphomicrobiales bacterium]MBO6913072.1 lipoyl domain-containing protein [Hyphomicrobiales bacterium]MBO6956660.1 lipoyl domain-containing protein [Hyphomicrobiales bacterium]